MSRYLYDVRGDCETVRFAQIGSVTVGLCSRNIEVNTRKYFGC